LKTFEIFGEGENAQFIKTINFTVDPPAGGGGGGGSSGGGVGGGSSDL